MKSTLIAFVSLLIVSAIVFAVLTRTAVDVFAYSLSIFVLSMVGCFLIFVVSGDRGALMDTLAGWSKPEIVLMISFLLLAIYCLSVALYGLMAATMEAAEWVLDLDESSSQWINFKKTLLIAIVMVLGGILFWFRAKLRAVYGLSEAAVGLMFAINTVNNPKSKQFELALTMLTASVYLIVRGLDNVHQGISRSPLDPVAAKVIDWLRGLKRRRPHAVSEDEIA